MKTAFAFTKLRLVRASWYIGLSLICFATLQGSCSCKINHDIYNPPYTPSLEFAKLSYDRDNNRLVIIIKNTGKEIVKNVSLRCTNISKDQKSRATVRFNNTPTTSTLLIPDLAPSTSTPEIYVSIDFQTAKEALVQMEIICGQQQAKTDIIQINKYPINLISIEPIIVIVNHGDSKEIKWKLIIDGPVDCTTTYLRINKIKGENIDVSIEGTSIVLNKLIDDIIITGTDLEKLLKQKEILVKIKNNKHVLNCICGRLFLNKDKEIASIAHFVVSSTQEALLPGVIHSDVNFVKQAIADGANVNTRNTNHESALHLATERDHQEIVQILLQNGAEVSAIDNDGNTALHIAACKGNQEIIKILLQHSANINAKNNQGETAADLAQDQEMKDLINNWGK